MFGLNTVAYWIIGALLALLLAAGGVVWWLNSSKNEVIKDNGRLELALTTQQGATKSAMIAVDAWKTAADKLQADLEAMAQNQADANEEIRRLNDVLAKHKLAELAKAKPGLVGNRVNAGTARMLGLLTAASSGYGSLGDSAPGPKGVAAKTRPATPH